MPELLDDPILHYSYIWPMKQSIKDAALFLYLQFADYTSCLRGLPFSLLVLILYNFLGRWLSWLLIKSTTVLGLTYTSTLHIYSYEGS